MKQKNQGFTLIEVMVVVVILSILATIIIPKVMDRPDTARLVKAQTDIRAIESALNLYKLDNFNYPTTEEGLDALTPKYIERLSNDPWGNPYLYLSPGLHGEMDVYTLGADGLQGGTGKNADIGNWNEEQ
ncbi:MAG: type II secretion system major pseudopilin GspG [Lysobacterales bacterium]